MKENQILDLKGIVDILSKFEGVVGVILFGSFARGDYDDYSDYDLLVLFEGKSSMWRCWDDLFKAVGTFRINLHVIPETLEEFRNANPVFLEELLKYGKVLFARLPMEVFLKPVKLKPFCLIFYEMAGLSYKDKMRLSYLLYRKKGEGLVARSGGAKFGEGCILVSSVMAEEILKVLEDFGVKTRKLEVFLSELF
ncbi:MAG: nucleotidyltransferase domain-containing protein [Fervidobacterium sp.]